MMLFQSIFNLLQHVVIAVNEKLFMGRKRDPGLFLGSVEPPHEFVVRLPDKSLRRER